MSNHSEGNTNQTNRAFRENIHLCFLNEKFLLLYHTLTWKTDGVICFYDGGDGLLILLLLLYLRKVPCQGGLTSQVEHDSVRLSNKVMQEQKQRIIFTV